MFIKRMMAGAALTVIGQKMTRKVAVSFALIGALVISACNDTNDPDEGGIIGTGMMLGEPVGTPGITQTDIALRGTVNSSTFSSSSIVKVKSLQGEVTELNINSLNQFSTDELPGTGPWVLGVQPSSDLTVFAIAHGDGTRNLNRFSDLALRHWFAQQLIDIDAEFASAARFSDLPDAAEYAESVAAVFQLIEPVLDSYNVSAEDVISADYSVNGQGIDAFLQQNTVLINDRAVSFLITEPTENTQSETSPALSLGSNFVDNGAIAPTPPQGVRALGRAIDEIVLIWEPSTDDVAVHEYQIIRDGSPVATTPFPSYTDSGLPMGESYEYQVVAIDGAGNQSGEVDLSGNPATIIASPLQTADVIPPPAPALLTELASSGSKVEFLWVVPSNIGDVVRFNVYRDREEQTSGVASFSVTGTVAIDTAVEENETYCYQVTAVDASGNESAFSENLCVNAGDTGMSSTNSASVPLEWNVPDIDSLDCRQQILSAQVLQGVTVIENGCYQVPETLSIGPEATLRLSAGAVLRFGPAAKLIVPKNATFAASGSRENPVVLTGNVSARGAWGGVEFQNSTSVGNLIRGTVIENAGGGDSLAAVAVTVGASRFRIEDTLVRNNLAQAFHFVFDNIVIDAFDGNRITANESVGQVNLPMLNNLAGNSDFSGNDNDELDIPRNRFSNVQISIPDIGIPLRWNGVFISRGALTIEPGVEFRMVSNSLVDVEGAFAAIGTEEQPIQMTGDSNTTQPNWAGLRLSGRGSKSLSYINLVDAGSASPQAGAIVFDCAAGGDAQLSMDNADISFSASWGVFISADNCDRAIDDSVTFFNNALGDINIP